MCSWSGSGDPSNMKKYTCGPTTPSPRRGVRSPGTSAFTTPADRIRALTGKHLIRPTSPRFRRSRQPEPGRRSTYPPKNLFRQVEPPQTEELERRYKAASDGIERGYLHIIWLLSQGRSAKFVAEVTGYTPTWVSKILWRYNDHGLAGLGDGRLDNPGAAPLLEPAQVEELRDLVSEPPPDGGLWTGRKGACWITGRIGRTVSPQRAQRLRHGNPGGGLGVR